jgi:polyisoprenoid-binding protein YceI
MVTLLSAIGIVDGDSLHPVKSDSFPLVMIPLNSPALINWPRSRPVPGKSGAHQQLTATFYDAPMFNPLPRSGTSYRTIAPITRQLEFRAPPTDYSERGELMKILSLLGTLQLLLSVRFLMVGWFAASVLFPSTTQAQVLSDVPVFEVIPVHSAIKFHVKASVTIAGKFDKWDASLTFTSPDETTGTLVIKIQADSVDTGSGMKDGKLKGKDFFDVTNYPEITFVSTKIVHTRHETYEVDGDFTIRGVSNPEKLTLTISGKGTGSGEIKGKMVFNRKDYGMNKGIPFIKVADHVDVDFHLNGKRVGGPPLSLRDTTPLFPSIRGEHSLLSAAQPPR